MSIIVNGITGEELVHGNSEGGSTKGPSADKSYLVAWADRIQFANGLLGFGKPTTSAGSTITFSTPHQHPELTNAYCQRVSMRGAGRPYQGTKQIAYPMAIVTGSYAFPEFALNMQTIDPSGQQSFDPASPFTYASQEFDFGGEYQTIPGSYLQFFDGTIIRERQTEFIATTKMVLTLHWMAVLPRNILNYIGKVNDRPFFTAAKGKVRFDGARTSMQFQIDGSLKQESVLTFTYRRVAPWGYVRRKSGAWDEVLNSVGDPIVESANLMDLIPSSYRY